MDLDETDAAILRALQDDARLSYRDLARRIGVSVPTVSARVTNLERLGILAGYHAAIDPEKLGQTRLVLFVDCRPARAEAVARALTKLPEIRWAIRTGKSGIVAEAVLPRSKHVDGFTRAVTGIDGVVSCVPHVAAKRLKDVPRAELSGPLAAPVRCFECGKALEGQPIRLRLEGRTHYLCCRSCEKLYRERYARIRAAASR